MSCNSGELYSQITAEGKILCKKRDTFDLTIEVLNEDGTAYDMTVFTELVMQVKVDPRSDVAILSLELGDGLEVTNNQVRMTRAPDQMDIVYNTYRYDLQGTKSDGTVITVAQGPFEVTSDITSQLAT